MFLPLTLAVVVASPAPTLPLRHLVYTFTWGTTNVTETRVSGFADTTEGSHMGTSSTTGAASGTATNSASNNDKGTITVDVMREQPDKGLIVVVGEQANGTRSTQPATCVVYGDTRVICDPDKKINDEELTLVQYLAANFVDPNAIDAKMHWKVSPSSTPDYSSTSDFTISSNANGIMKIDETRVVKEAGNRSMSITGSIGYDFNRQVPTSLDEYAIERSEAGDQYTTLKTQTVLQLQSDSMAKT